MKTPAARPARFSFGRHSIRHDLLVGLLICAGIIGLGLGLHFKAQARFAEVRQLTTIPIASAKRSRS